MTACAFCLEQLPADDMCRHGRFLCHTDCLDYCTPEDES